VSGQLPRRQQLIAPLGFSVVHFLFALQYTASSLAWDIALAIILALGVVFTADSQKNNRAHEQTAVRSHSGRNKGAERSNRSMLNVGGFVVRFIDCALFALISHTNVVGKQRCDHLKHEKGQAAMVAAKRMTAISSISFHSAACLYLPLTCIHSLPLYLPSSPFCARTSSSL
jgi:xanthine/uracil/vitamin C permease (AzgA family)